MRTKHLVLFATPDTTDKNKHRREGVQLPEHPAKGHSSSLLAPNRSIIGSGSMLLNPYLEVPSMALAQYENDMQNPELWLIREEERIGFEVKYDLGDGQSIDLFLCRIS